MRDSGGLRRGCHQGEPESALVLITTSFPVLGDGSEAAGSFIADLVDELSKRQSVRVVAPGSGPGREFRGERLEVFRFGAPDRPLSTLRPWRPADLLAIRRVLASGLATTRSAVAAGPTHHLLALWALPSGHWARCVAHQSGIPYSVWTLGSDIWSLGRLPGLRAWLRIVLRGADQLWSDGMKLASDTAAIAGRPATFLPSTRRLDSTRQVSLRSEPPYRLLFLGRWHRNKGVDLLLEALTRLDERDWSRIEMVEICGGGPLQHEVQRAVASLQSARRPVSVQGFLDKAAAEAAFQRADYVVVPSRIESIPVVFSDAMKLGCPVVASPVGDLIELVAEAPACGILARDVSAQGIAEALSRALSLRPLDFLEGVSAMAKRFDLQEVASRLHEQLGEQT